MGKRETEIACARWDERLRVLEAVGKFAQHIMDNPREYASAVLPPADPRTAAIIAAECSGYAYAHSRDRSRLNLPMDFPDFSVADMDRYRASRVPPRPQEGGSE